MATNVKYDETKEELIVRGIAIAREQERNVLALVKMVIDNLSDTVPADVVQRNIRKSVPLAGTPAGALRAYRLREDLTQEQLAKKAG